MMHFFDNGLELAKMNFKIMTNPEVISNLSVMYM